jgi:flagellum-specific peptidoglycan hydrolase FlgJ
MKTIRNDWRDYLLAAILFALCIAGRAQTIEQVRDEIQRQGIEHPEIVLAQSILETGWYKSHGCTHRKNLFGFYWKGSYKKWSTWQESIKYYADWQRRHYTGGDYYKFLESVGYASDLKYISKLKNIKP